MAVPTLTFYRNYNSSDETEYYGTYHAGDILPTISDLGWSAPSGKEFKEWNTLSTGNGYSFAPGVISDDFRDSYFAIWQDIVIIDYLTTDQELASVADAIRAKGGTSASLTYPDEFISAIQAIETGIDISDTTAIAGDVLSGKYFYTSSGTKTQGTIATKTASNLSASGKTVTVPSGYYASQYTKDVVTGTEGTPTATKGTVSNNSVSVTPSVINVAGYISGGTKTGTAVTVSASELVSGTKTISASGTTDVTNYANASVAAGSATTPATTITTAPSITVSSAGLITATNSKTQSVTPTVSAGYVSSGTAGTITVNGSNTSQLTVQAAQTITPTTTDQTIASGKYLTGTQTIKGDANLVAGNIKKDVTIFGVTGTHEGGGVIISDTTDANGGTIRTITTSGSAVKLQAKTNINPTSSSQTITPDTGYDGLSSVQINAASGGGTPLTTDGHQYLTIPLSYFPISYEGETVTIQINCDNNTATKINNYCNRIELLDNGIIGGGISYNDNYPWTVTVEDVAYSSQYNALWLYLYFYECDNTANDSCIYSVTFNTLTKILTIVCDEIPSTSFENLNGSVSFDLDFNS